jgi:Tfp pilus assembly protein PilO
MGNKFVPVGIMVIALLGLLVVKPLVLDLKVTNAKIYAFKNQTEETNRKIDALRQLEPQLNAAKEQINALKIAMPAAQQIPEVLVMMEAIAKEVGMQISGIEVQPSGGNDEVGVSLSAKGNYTSLAKFCETLEQNVRPIQIRTLSLGSGSEKGEIVSATVSLGVIYQGTLPQQVAPIN